METDTEFQYPNIIDFFGKTLCHICNFTALDLFDYAAYDKYAEGNINKSNLDVSDQISRLLEKSDEINHEYIIGSFSTEFKEI